MPATTPTAGDAHPHRRVAEGVAHLQAEERRRAPSPTDHVLPNTPMYAPRMSAGANAATTACDVGTHSISPITNSTITSAITGAEPLTFRSRNGTPISGIATPSFSEAGTPPSNASGAAGTSVDEQRVDDHQHAPRRGREVVRRRRREIGSSVSVAMYVMDAKHRREHEEQERRVADDHAERAALRRRLGAYAPPRGM